MFACPARLVVAAAAFAFRGAAFAFRGAVAFLAVFFSLPAALRRPPLLLFADLAPAPVFLLDGLFFSPFLVPLFFAIAGVSPIGSRGVRAGRSAG